MKHIATCILLLTCNFISTTGFCKTKSRLTNLVMTNYKIPNGYIARDSSNFSYTGYHGYDIEQSGTSAAFFGKYDTAVNMYFIDVAHGFYTYDRIINSYDSHDNLTSTLLQNYDTTAKTWINSQLTTLGYDSHNNLTSKLLQYWNTGSWLNYFNYIYVFNSKDQLVSDSTNLWNSGSSAWQYGGADEYSYDSLNNMTLLVVSAWGATTGWYNSGKYNYYYNTHSKQDSALRYSYDNSVHIWIPYQKDIYTYDLSLNMLADTQSYWYSSSLSWKYSKIYSYTYASAGMPTNETDYYWNSALPGWTNSFQYFYVYDASSNLELNTHQTWSLSSSVWVNQQKDSMTYNSDKQVVTHNNYVWSTSTWTSGANSQDRYHYESYIDPTDVKSVTKQNATVALYPNPAKDVLHISIKWGQAQTGMVAIYDMSGQLFMQKQIEKADHYECSIPVSQLPAGNYVLQVKSENAEAREQFTVLH